MKELKSMTDKELTMLQIRVCEERDKRAEQKIKDELNKADNIPKNKIKEVKDLFKKIAETTTIITIKVPVVTYLDCDELSEGLDVAVSSDADGCDVWDVISDAIKTSKAVEKTEKQLIKTQKDFAKKLLALAKEYNTDAYGLFCNVIYRTPRKQRC
jgi:hypothetical protein